MTDLKRMSAELSSSRSEASKKSDEIIRELYGHLSRPSENTAAAFGEWSEDFRYIYGSAAENLSSNGKLDRGELAARFGISTENENELMLLFFAVQTFFSILIKALTADVLTGRTYSPVEIVTGSFAADGGIMDYCDDDCYCRFGSDENVHDTVSRIIALVGSFHTNEASADDHSDCDYIKQIYESVIPKELRHALGEYYTPRWLAEYAAENAAAMSGKDIRTLTVTDPACGSGTFLMQMISAKKKAGCCLSEIISTVNGSDINPLAVLTAKTNYILSVRKMLDGTAVSIPVYRADVLHMNEETAERLGKADIIIGNPPWVNREYLSKEYRKNSDHLWQEYGLFSAKGRDRSFSKEDISVLITAVTADRLLKSGGILSFVIRQPIFRGAKNGTEFRRFAVRDVPLKVIKADDLSAIRVFENATVGAAVMYAKKGEPTEYPVPYDVWTKKSTVRGSFGQYEGIGDVMEKVDIFHQQAVPSSSEDITSPWLTAPADTISSMKRLLGKNNFRARTGVFTGGANAVYWLDITDAAGENVIVRNITDRAKRKALQISAELEKEHIYPMLRGSGIGRWKAVCDGYILCPHTAKTKQWPVSEDELEKSAPLTMDYLRQFRTELDGRKGFAGWEKAIQESDFHAVLRVGEYTFSPYKVVWKYIATEFVCAVISCTEDAFLGEKLILPNEKVMYVSTDSADEAYYLCGILSSSAVSACVKGYMNPTSISAHVLTRLAIPGHDPENVAHARISRLCREGHGADDISPFIREIDDIVSEIYGI